MNVVNMPGGAIQNIGDIEWLWFRRAFASEWDGATMSRLTDDRIYSIESVADLTKNNQLREIRLAVREAPQHATQILKDASVSIW